MNNMFKIITSNQNKINEYKRFGILSLEVISGKDIREVSGTSEEVVLYKAIEAGEEVIVEDSILEIDGVEIVDIKYQLKNLKNHAGKEAKFKVSLGYLQNGVIKTYSATLTGNIQDVKKPEVCFGFDYCFFPTNSIYSLHELELQGHEFKDKFSPRKQAILKLLNNQYDNMYKIEDIKPWNGEYQI